MGTFLFLLIISLSVFFWLKKRYDEKELENYIVDRNRKDKEFDDLLKRSGLEFDGEGFKIPEETDVVTPPKIDKFFKCTEYEKDDEIEPNTWYRLKGWKYPDYYLLRKSKGWSSDWKLFMPLEEEIVGVKSEDRQKNFLLLGDLPDFKFSLEREPDNAFDKNAIKVMGSATVDGEIVKKHLGYIEKDASVYLSGETDLEVGSASLLLPYEGKRFSLRLQILIRSQAYKKRILKEASANKNDGH